MVSADFNAVVVLTDFFSRGALAFPLRVSLSFGALLGFSGAVTGSDVSSGSSVACPGCVLLFSLGRAGS